MKLSLLIKPLLWLLLMCYGFFTSPATLPKTVFLKIPHFDKIVHFGLFFIFTLLLFKPIKATRSNHWLSVFFVALFFAITIELFQGRITPTRSSSFFDFLANCAGILSGITLYKYKISGTILEKYL